MLSEIWIIYHTYSQGLPAFFITAALFALVLVAPSVLVRQFGAVLAEKFYLYLMNGRSPNFFEEPDLP